MCMNKWAHTNNKEKERKSWKCVPPPKKMLALSGGWENQYLKEGEKSIDQKIFGKCGKHIRVVASKMWTCVCEYLS